MVDLLYTNFYSTCSPISAAKIKSCNIVWILCTRRYAFLSVLVVIRQLLTQDISKQVFTVSRLIVNPAAQQLDSGLCCRGREYQYDLDRDTMLLHSLVKFHLFVPWSHRKLHEDEAAGGQAWKLLPLRAPIWLPPLYCYPSVLAKEIKIGIR